MTIKIGDILDQATLTKLMDGASSGLFNLNWDVMGPTQRTIDRTTRWKPGYKNGRWANNANGSGPVWWSTLNEGSEDELYPTLDCINANGPSVSVIRSDGPGGPVRIHPRMFTAAELAKYGTRPQLANHAWLSFAMVTAPDCVQPPAYFELKCQFPAGHNGDLSGIWLAFWQLDNSGAWPPESDTFETFGNSSTGRGPDFESAVHTTDKTWAAKLPAGLPWVAPDGSTASQRLSPLSFDPSAAMHTYGTLFTADGIYDFIDRKCTMVWPQTSDLLKANLYPIIDLSIGKPGSGAGAPAVGVTDIGEVMIADASVWRYNAAVSPTGPTGPTAPTGATGNTGSTGATGAPGGVTAAQITAIQQAQAKANSDLAQAQSSTALVQTMLAALKPAS